MVDAQKLLNDVIALSKQYPNARYNMDPVNNWCLYSIGVVNNGPSTEGCIIGQAARNQPEFFATLVEFDLKSPSHNGGYGIHDIVTTLKIDGAEFCSPFEVPEIWQMLLLIQSHQDNGDTWGECISEALEVYEHLL